MDALLIALKQKLESGNFTAEDYNNYIYGGVATELIKDVTPPNIVLAAGHVVYAIIELPDGSKYEIDIYEKIRVDPNIPNYDISVKKTNITNIRNN